MSPHKPFTTQEIDSFLAALSPDCTRAGWIAIGQALHAWDSSDTGLDLWDIWSRQSAKYIPGECATCWRGFRPDGGINPGTLKALAIEEGWRPDTAQNRDSRPAAPRTPPPATADTPEPPADHSRHLWKSIEESRQAIKTKMRQVVKDGLALEFLQCDYGLDPEIFESTPAFLNLWYVFTHPSLGPGIVTIGKTPAGAPCQKFRSFARNEKHKRSQAFLFAAAKGPAAMCYPRAGSPLVIVSGEEKGAAAHMAGFAVLCGLTGESALHKDWLPWVLAQGPPKIILANDNDEAGAGANLKTATLLEKAGYPKFKINFVKWSDDAPKGYDLNDALKDGVDLFELLEEAPCPAPRRSFMGLRDFEVYHPPENTNYMGDRVLSAGEMVSVAGIGGIGKSRATLQLAICSVLGFDWGALKTHAQGKKWLFIQTENSAARTKNDYLPMTRGLPDAQRLMLHDCIRIQGNLNDLDMENNLDDPVAYAALAAEIADYDPDIVVWDPLTDFFIGENEDASMQMRNTTRTLKRLSQTIRRDVITFILHHSRGGHAGASGILGLDKSEFARGSKALRNSCRSQILMAPGTTELADNIIVVDCGKNNNGRLFERFAVRLDEDRMWYQLISDFDFDEWETMLGKGKNKRGAGRKPLEIDKSSITARLKTGEETAQSTVVFDVMKHFAMSESTVKRKVKELVELGEIVAREEPRGGARPPKIWLRLP